ncbi:embryogenesis-like protein [Cornus florida]|uniref:embryogenesis-like protein n=1 Tax=Cornus florida TaxID=4283 RepID=UPI00289F42F2|nr:embryogenesis-like protein [Cornus florida]
MHQRSPISLCKLLSRYPFQRSAIPGSSISLQSLEAISNHCVSDSVPHPKPMKICHFLHPNISSPTTLFFSNRRNYSVDTNKVVDEINLKFAEAREEIDMAMESKETVYFDEEAECARTAVKDVVDMFEGLLSKLPETERAPIQRSMGLKIEQLKAEVEQLND